MASGAPMARCSKPLAWWRSKAAFAARRRCWWASSSTWGSVVPRSCSPRVSQSRGELVDQLGALDHDPLVEHEEAGPLAIGEEDADRLVLAGARPRAGRPRARG